MKIWSVWFSDCFSTSHALFFFSSKTCWGLWIVVWTWAFFFLPGKFIWASKTCWGLWIVVWTWAFFFLPGKFIWASKIKSSILGPNQHSPFEPSFSFPMWYNKLLSYCRIWVSGRTHIQYRFIEFRSKKQVKPIGYSVSFQSKPFESTQTHNNK